MSVWAGLNVCVCVCVCVCVPELSERVQAAVCLRYLVYDHEKRGAWRSIEGVVAEMLPLTMEELFGLMDQVGSDELVTTLDVLISSFAARILPYAQGLCLRLSETFIRFACSEDFVRTMAVARRSPFLLAGWRCAGDTWRGEEARGRFWSESLYQKNGV